VISEPENDLVHIYTINTDTKLSGGLIPYQTLTGVSSSGFGHAVAISGDSNWIYTSTKHGVINAYHKEVIPYTAPYIRAGKTYQITSLGNTDYKALGAEDNVVGLIFKATASGTGTGTVNRINYVVHSRAITGNAGNGFGYSLTTNYDGSVLTIGAPYANNLGAAYVYQRTAQTIEAQNNTVPPAFTNYPLAWTPGVSALAGTSINSNFIAVSDTTGLKVE
jgi:hypothetical protein